MKKVINHIKADASIGKDWTTAGCDCKACAGERGPEEAIGTERREERHAADHRREHDRQHDCNRPPR